LTCENNALPSPNTLSYIYQYNTLQITQEIAVNFTEE